jgi:hypothetical protein
MPATSGDGVQVVERHVVVVHGGVCGDVWHNDMQAVVITHTGA